MDSSENTTAASQLAPLAQMVDCAVVILRPDGQILYFNPFAESSTGYSAAEVLGRNFYALFATSPSKPARGTSSAGANDQPASEFSVEDTPEATGGPQAESGSAESGSAACRQRCCNHAWTFQELADLDGQPLILAVAKEAESPSANAESLRQAAWLQAVMETAIDGIVMIDQRGRIQTVNPAAERIFGYRGDEMVGKNISMLMPPPYQAEHDGYLKQYLRTGEKKVIGVGREVAARRKDGSTFPCEIAVSELSVSGRKMFSGVVRDITEQRRAQDALRERETFLQTIFETEPECVSVHDREGELLRMNRAGLEMIGADSIHEARAIRFDTLVAEKQRRAFESLTSNVFQGRNESLQFDIVGLKGDKRKLEMHAVPLRDSDGEITALLGVTRDITEQRRAEERALQAERLAAIGETVAGLAHESRNAFQRSQACLEMLAIELDGRPAELQLVDRTQKALDHLHRLYEEVRDYAAPITLDKQVCDASHVWRDAWAHLEVTRRDKAVVLEEQLRTDDFDCDLDWFALGQVFRNVFENGIAACPSPGKIILQCEAAEIDGKPALRVAIRDNGEGIAKELQGQVFDAFFTTKTKGTGLGMAIARRIVEAHGGRIQIGAPEAGAEFIIDLPRQ